MINIEPIYEKRSENIKEILLPIISSYPEEKLPASVPI